MLVPGPIDSWVEAFNPYLGHIHINDNDLLNDMHFAPGEGEIDFEKYIKLLGNTADRNINTLIEVSNIENQTKGLEYLSKIFK